MSPHSEVQLSEGPGPSVDDPELPSGGWRGLTTSATWCARAVLIGIVLYAAIDTALVFLRPQFSILHNAESDYGSSGSWGWLMDLNFLLRCLLSLAAVRAITLTLSDSEKRGRLRLGLGLLVVWALASGLLAFFPDDPVGTTLRWHGRVHLGLAFVAFPAVLVGAVLVSLALRTHPRWKPVATPMLVLSWGALIPLLLLVHTHFRANSLGGLYEKIFLAAELVWLLVVAAPIAVEHRARPAGLSRRR
jgi:hypothetical membrane protein